MFCLLPNDDISVVPSSVSWWLVRPQREAERSYPYRLGEARSKTFKELRLVDACCVIRSHRRVEEQGNRTILRALRFGSL